MCALNLHCSIQTVSNMIRNYMDRCNYDWLNGYKAYIKCMVSAFVHYRAIYLTENNNDYDYYGYDDDNEESNHTHYSTDMNQSTSYKIMSCDLNITNLVHHVEHLHLIAPATRSDDNYWPRFDECYHHHSSLK